MQPWNNNTYLLTREPLLLDIFRRLEHRQPKLCIWECVNWVQRVFVFSENVNKPPRFESTKIHGYCNNIVATVFHDKRNWTIWKYCANLNLSWWDKKLYNLNLNRSVISNRGTLGGDLASKSLSSIPNGLRVSHRQPQDVAMKLSATKMWTSPVCDNQSNGCDLYEIGTQLVITLLGECWFDSL